MKLLELIVENQPGVPDGAYSFADAAGAPRDVVVLGGDVAGVAGVLLETIAALLEVGRPPRAPHPFDWWAQRRGAHEARLRARWALSDGEAESYGGCSRTLTSEWRFGPGDELPRELMAGGAPAARVRVALTRSVHLDANRSSVWLGGPAADPLAEALAEVARRDVVATRAFCRPGVGLVRATTPDTFAHFNRVIAPILPGVRLERIACGRGERPVACFRGEQRVELDELAGIERDAIHIITALHLANVRDGVILVDGADLHVPREAHAPWLDWLVTVAATNQLIVRMAPPTAPTCSERASR
jgi:hypothetical protein